MFINAKSVKCLRRFVRLRYCYVCAVSTIDYVGAAPKSGSTFGIAFLFCHWQDNYSKCLFNVSFYIICVFFFNFVNYIREAYLSYSCQYFSNRWNGDSVQLIDDPRNIDCAKCFQHAANNAFFTKEAFMNKSQTHINANIR